MRGAKPSSTRAFGYQDQPHPHLLPARGPLRAARRTGISPDRCAVLAVWLATAGMSGCGGDARVELSAADSIESLAGALELALQEYHADLATGDDLRESAAIAAFVKRIQEASDDPAGQDRHVAEFTAALHRIRQDRRVEWTRFGAGQDNLDTLREITGGLRRLAVESLTLRDEARRYIYALIDQRRSKSADRQDRPPS
ncbi:MAG: hypothetical protein V2A79_05495 [Planctomycetota bacterium]